MEGNNQPTRPASKKRGMKMPSLTNYLNLMNVLLLVAIAAAVFFGIKWHQADNKLKHPDAATNAAIAKAQTDETVNQVSKLVQLPSGETPTIATVSDVSKLKGQAFFANAQNGDKVLIYVKAKQAILYRPSTNKVINVAPLNLSTKKSS